MSYASDVQSGAKRAAVDPVGGMGHAGAVAVRKARLDGWRPFKWERVGDSLLMTGCVPGIYKNGKTRWAKPHTRVVVTDDEIASEGLSYERTTGRCRECFGSGQDWIGWSASEGNKYRTCRRCDGMGDAKEKA